MRFAFLFVLPKNILCLGVPTTIRTMKMNFFVYSWKKITLANLINRDGYSFRIFRGTSVLYIE